MAYSNGHPGRVEITRIICDKCAIAPNSEIPFDIKSDGLPMQRTPWCWFPCYGADCMICDKPC
ncbi:hypothetical protein LCGC14_1908690 [marine sediment metagenome]|uniref:Uncharacterized protein n=1 Tax=marine sediment metagenome TaxID=412755 RepID=A0A0F9FUB5_9ZZZZ